MTTTVTTSRTRTSVSPASPNSIRLALTSNGPKREERLGSEDTLEAGLDRRLERLSLAEEDPLWSELFAGDCDGDTQLHLAVASANVDVVSALVRLADRPDLLDQRNHAGFSPMHLAVIQNAPNIVRRLVVAGARTDVCDTEGNTALHLAARRGHVECAEALLKPVAVHEVECASLRPSLMALRRPPSDRLLDLANHAGERSVHLAAVAGHVSFLRLLAWNGADVDAAEDRAGRTPLHLAVAARHVHVVRCLLAARPVGCQANAGLRDWYGRTALGMAVYNGMGDMARVLAAHAHNANLGEDTDGDDDEYTEEEEDSEEEEEEEEAILNHRGYVVKSSA